MTGQDGEPADMLCQPVDSYSAALSVIAIQSALFAREQTGRGQQVDIALVEAYNYLQSALQGRQVLEQRGLRAGAFGAPSATPSDCRKCATQFRRVTRK